MASEVGPIIFFDGTCGLCDRTVRWLMQKDTDRFFKFASLQGETAKRLLGAGAAESQTIILWSHGKTWERSEAALRILKMLGGWPSGAAREAGWIPRFLRDPIYSLIARYRKKVFGETTCAIPPNSTQILP